MKAFVFERTGDPNDVLAVRELPNRSPVQVNILVRVKFPRNVIDTDMRNPKE